MLSDCRPSWVPGSVAAFAHAPDMWSLSQTGIHLAKASGQLTFVPLSGLFPHNHAQNIYRWLMIAAAYS